MYSKEINGVVVKRLLKEIILEKDGMCIYNPTREMVLDEGWTDADSSSETDELSGVGLEMAKHDKLVELHNYDLSSEINDCIIEKDGKDIHFWASKTERDSLKGALKDFLTLGREYYRLDFRNAGLSVRVRCEQLLGMLANLEVYAADCYNKTTDHEFFIKACTTEEEVKLYDYKTGYPQVLRFQL
jgi:hypothetical protein